MAVLKYPLSLLNEIGAVYFLSHYCQEIDDLLGRAASIREGRDCGRDPIGPPFRRYPDC